MLRRRVRKVLGWVTLLLLAILGGGGWFAYSYVTDNETLRSAIRENAPKFLPSCLVDVGRVKWKPVSGEVVTTMVSVRKVEAGSPVFVLSSPWVHVLYDARAMLEGRLELKSVVVAQPTMRVRRRKDGTWNLLDLLADPWPIPPAETSPLIQIEKGTIEFVDEADGPEARPEKILRDVTISIAPSANGDPIRFEATANGDLFDKLHLFGTVDRRTGRVVLAGDVHRLVISENLAARLPAEARPQFLKLGLSGGEVDLTLNSFVHDPSTSAPPRYNASVRIRSGVWKCERMPFPVNDLAADVTIRDGLATVERARGHNGQTIVKASGVVTIGDLERVPFRFEVSAEGLELDERLKGWTITCFKKPAFDFWNDFRPKGSVDGKVRFARATAGAPIAWDLEADCRDVAAMYSEFRYPIEHVSGHVTASPALVAIELRTLVAGKPLTAKGTIERPGPRSVVNIDFTTESLPIDVALLDAMPPDVRRVVDSFKPGGSSSVKGRAHLRRTPPAAPGDPPKGKIDVDADLDLNPECEITWDDLKYPVRGLTGHLELHPSSWIFTNMRGTHGQATITGSGRVDRSSDGRYKVDIALAAENILFESQLRDALPPAWLKTWNTLNPAGASDVQVRIVVEPGKPDHYHLEVVPRPETRVRLRFEPVGVVGDASSVARQIEMQMEDVSGKFVFDDGVVTMKDGRFRFHGSPVEFVRGQVRVADSGQFELAVEGLDVKQFRLDNDLFKLMPPVMAQFLRKLDNQTLVLKGDLALEWSGKLGEPAICGWRNGMILFLETSFQGGLPLKALQGQIDHVSGQFDGRSLAVRGALEIASVSMFDVQVTDLSTPIVVEAGLARFTDIRGTVIKGKVTGTLAIGLESSPKYEANLAIEGADLQSYTRSVAGRQEVRGLIAGEVNISGTGGDVRSIQGKGSAHMTRGDLGKLPILVRLLKTLSWSPTTATAFDKADVAFAIRNGVTTLDPIKFFGDAISLRGHGTIDVQGDLDVPLQVVYSRDKWHLPALSDAIREAEGQFVVIRVKGSLLAPTVKLEFLPAVGEIAKARGNPREAVAPRR